MIRFILTLLMSGYLSVSAQNDSGVISLRDAIGRLEVKHGIKFSYIDQWIAGVSVRLPLSGTVDEQVTAVLRGTNLGFRYVTEKHIALFKNAEPIHLPVEKPVKAKQDTVRKESSIDTVPSIQLAAAEEMVIPILPLFQDTTRLESEIEAADNFFHFSLWKNIHTDPMHPSTPSRHNVSLNVLSRREMDIQGIELGLMGNFKRRSVEGLQIGVGGNSTSGPMSGIQIGVAVNRVGQTASGIQIAGGFNRSRTALGLQAAAVNISREVSGVQSGVTNLTFEKISGLQVGGANLARQVYGVQVGLFNRARHVHGVQIGLINMADSSDGLALGVVNIIRNGQRHVQLWSAENRFLHITYKHGTRTFYTLYDVGFHRLEEPPRWSAGIGIGAEVARYRQSSLFIESSVHHISENTFWSNHLNMHIQLRLLPTVHIADRFGVFAGPTANLWLSRDNNGYAVVRGKEYVYDGKKIFARGWFGFNAGLQF